MAYLAALPASARANGGLPVVLMVPETGELPAEARDFLERWKPAHVAAIGALSASKDALYAHEPVDGGDAAAVACALARRYFERSEAVVVCASGDYSAALAGAVLATRLRAPLLYADAQGPGPAVGAELDRLAPARVMLVGAAAARMDAALKGKGVPLATADDVALWMHGHGHAVGYLAVAAAADRTSGRHRKLSLSAAALAAGRGGAVALLGDELQPPSDFATARSAIQAALQPLGRAVEHLCLVGAPDVLPMNAIEGSGIGIDKDPPSDLEYGDIDADPFVDLALGRFVAEDGAAASLLAARSLVYEQIADNDAARTLAMAEWERGWDPLFANAGFETTVRHAGGAPIAQDSPLKAAAVIVHSAHSSWLQMGETYTHDSTVLLAPCLVESGGCSPAALDQDPERRSVALRLLRNGAIGFVGSVRSAIAEHELYRSEFWNAVLAGRSLGQAHRHALNRALVACLARDGDAQRPLRYQLRNAAFYGDPALVLHLPGKPRARAANAEARGREVTVRAPGAWSRVELYAPPDWKYDASPAIYGWRGAGVGIESSWDPAFRRNREVLVCTAEVRTERKSDGLKVLDTVEAPLGWDQRVFIDEHADGTRSLYFRVRMIDFDMSTGKVLAKLERLRLRLD